MGGNKVTAIILNWNNYPDTKECIDSLATIDYDTLDILVVDNGSTDRSGEKIANEYPSLQVKFNDQNRGFSGGMNSGINEIDIDKTEYIWLLNNDILFPDSEVLHKLIQTISEHPNIGVVSPLIRCYPKTNEIWFKKGVIDWKTGNVDHTDVPDTSKGRIVDSEYIPNCCSLFRADIFEKVGLLPERYFIYYEDVDHGIQIRNAGYRLVTDTKATVYHQQGGTAGDEFDPLYSYYKARNTLLLAQKYPNKLKKSFWIMSPMWAVSQLVNRFLKDGRSGMIPFIRGIRDGVRRKTGKGPYP